VKKTTKKSAAKVARTGSSHAEDDPVVIWLLRMGALGKAFGEGDWRDAANNIVDAWDRGRKLPEIIEMMGLKKEGRGRPGYSLRDLTMDQHLVFEHIRAVADGEPDPIQKVADDNATSKRSVERALQNLRRTELGQSVIARYTRFFSVMNSDVNIDAKITGVEKILESLLADLTAK
jgi:hypothetical protein